MNKIDKKYYETHYFAADTENTVPSDEWLKNNDVKNFKTRVWLCGYAEIGTEDLKTFESLQDFLNSLVDDTPAGKIVVYFHNLAYDGQALLYCLMSLFNYQYTNDKKGKWRPAEQELSTMIDGNGSWFSIRLNWDSGKHKRTIEIRDSLKILPFDLEKIAKNFKTKYKKLVGDIDYQQDRPEGYKITEDEMRYFRNDVLILAEALKMIQPYGLLDNLTIGSTCVKDFKKSCKAFDAYFPQLDSETDAAIRKSYRGGFCYVNPLYADKIIKAEDYDVNNGVVLDVNSLYPWAMHSSFAGDYEEHYYPIGNVKVHKTSEEDFEKYEDSCYFVRFVADFKVKEGHIPFIQIKKSRFKDNEYITDSRGVVELTLTRMDFELFQEQYDINYFEILEYWVFNGTVGIFDNYIDKWYKKKEEATIEKNACLRQIAKLMLNNLYGKLSAKGEGYEKSPKYNSEKDLIQFSVSGVEKKTFYIPAGSYITSYARCKTIRAAQANYEYFLYSDTDSIHLITELENVKDAEIDPLKLGAWANEGIFNQARYVRQKTYIEQLIEKDENGDTVYTIDVKAAGATQDVKKRIVYDVEEDEEIAENENGEIITPMRDTDTIFNMFTYGLEIQGKLSRKVVTGGCILYDQSFRINRD